MPTPRRDNAHGSLAATSEELLGNYAREHTARIEAESARQRQTLLAEASKHLAGSLDYQATLWQVATLAIPGFADYCVVHLVDEHGVLCQAAVTHSDPNLVTVLRALHRDYPLDPNATGGVANVVRTGETAYYPDVPRRLHTAHGRDSAHAAILRRLGSRSAVIVPLVTRGRTLGALSFVRSISEQHYNADDVVLAEELARCAAQAIDNARLYQAAQHEITERKRVEEALRANEERYRSVVASLQEGIVLHQADGAIAACNASAERILGVSTDQLLGLMPDDPRWPAIHEDGSPFPGEQHPAMVTRRTGKPQSNLVMGFRKPTGELTWISINSQPLTLPGDDPRRVAVVSSLTDVTERTHLFEQVEEERAKLAGIVDSMSDGLILFANDGLISYCNGRASELLRVAHGLLLGKRADEAFAEAAHLYADPHSAWSAWQAALANLDQRPAFDLTVSAGPSRDLQIRMFRVPGEPLLSAGVGMLIRDLTAERDLVRAKDELIAMVSHELASPATNLIAYAELLTGATGYSDVEQREMLDTMAGEGRRLTAIIRDFLDVQRLEHGQLQVQPRPMDLSSLLKHAAVIARSDSAHPLVLDIPERLPLVQGDPDRVQQVLANLLSNAQKYTPADGRIYLSAHALDDTVQVYVADEGLGIPAHALPKLFDKFYRVDTTDRRHITGTGLGLAIVRRIVESLGGEVGVASAGPGLGSRFWFTLPLARSSTIERPRLPSIKQAQPVGGGSRLHVLSVDDDLATGSALKRVLRPEGYHLVTTSSAVDALRCLEMESFDVVISDLNLGGEMDGWELAAVVRTRWPKVRFVLASGSIGIDPIEANERGIAALLSKPYGHQELLQLLARFVSSNPARAA